MMKKKIKILLVFGLFFASLGGGWMHFNYHPFSETGYGWVPFIVGLISVILVPLLFMFRKTLNLAYLLNGFAVIIGTITMAHFSLRVAPIWADIVILWAKFVIGRAIFCLEIYPMDSHPRVRGLSLIRYPNLGFWYVHLVAWSLIYFLGNVFWR
jgi:hypothetical protein